MGIGARGGKNKRSRGGFGPMMPKGMMEDKMKDKKKGSKKKKSGKY